ncbi:FAD-dependent oxidoreductase [bacterium]|nr:FAD-dependent oxidoreductase [bacterium]
MKYDVLVVGGGTAGCSCAYTAAKMGLKTLLVEKNSFLGGSITSSLVIPAMKTSDNAINTDFFDELYKNLKSLNGAITYSDGNKGWFNPELTKIVLEKMLTDVGVNIMLESEVDKIEENLSSYIVAIHSDNTLNTFDGLSLSIETIYMVDATGDAKICEKLNCDFLENKNNSQPINLRFIMSGINSDKFVDWLIEFDKNRDVTTSCRVDDSVYCSTAYTWDSSTDWALKPLFKKAIQDGILTEQDSNYFQLFSVAGAPDSIAFNCPRILDNNISNTDAYIQGRASILRISNFCKKYFPGFENAYISNIANSLGIRVSRRVKGKYVYTQDDLKSGKKFDSPVVISNYPIDIHSNKKDCSKLEHLYQEYQLPIESLIVKDNLFVIGRCISADFESQAALRIIPSCFSMGEGLAKYIASLK